MCLQAERNQKERETEGSGAVLRKDQAERIPSLNDFEKDVSFPQGKEADDRYDEDILNVVLLNLSEAFNFDEEIVRWLLPSSPSSSSSPSPPYGDVETLSSNLSDDHFLRSALHPSIVLCSRCIAAEEETRALWVCAERLFAKARLKQILGGSNGNVWEVRRTYLEVFFLVFSVALAMTCALPLWLLFPVCRLCMRRSWNTMSSAIAVW